MSMARPAAVFHERNVCFRSKAATNIALHRSGVVDREQLNALKSQRVGGEPGGEAEHFYICQACGEAVDMRRLGDVLHHQQPGHEPLKKPS
jgi:hypothetical protein